MTATMLSVTAFGVKFLGFIELCMRQKVRLRFFFTLSLAEF